MMGGKLRGAALSSIEIYILLVRIYARRMHFEMRSVHVLAVCVTRGYCDTV